MALGHIWKRILFQDMAKSVSHISQLAVRDSQTRSHMIWIIFSFLSLHDEAQASNFSRYVCSASAIQNIPFILQKQTIIIIIISIKHVISYYYLLYYYLFREDVGLCAVEDCFVRSGTCPLGPFQHSKRHDRP